MFTSSYFKTFLGLIPCRCFTISCLPWLSLYSISRTAPKNFVTTFSHLSVLSEFTQNTSVKIVRGFIISYTSFKISMVMIIKYTMYYFSFIISRRKIFIARLIISRGAGGWSLRQRVKKICLYFIFIIVFYKKNSFPFKKL